MPVHPRTKTRLVEFNIKIASNLILIEPVGYIDMIMLQKNASLIATDSGGIQKEAYFYKIPCITLRDETEWTELVQYGANHITGSDVGRIAHFVEKIPDFPESIIELYGDGLAGEKITDSLLTSGLM
jgi:UDP-GlcNAc3NAcA epimerase